MKFSVFYSHVHEIACKIFNRWNVWTCERFFSNCETRGFLWAMHTLEKSIPSSDIFFFNYSISHFLLETKTSKLFMGISAVFLPILFIVARTFFFEYRQNLDMFFNGNWNATIKWNPIVKRYDFSFFIADNFTKKIP